MDVVLPYIFLIFYADIHFFVQFVDVSQEVVLRACLPNGDDTVKKVFFFENTSF